MHPYVALALYLALTIGGGLLIGAVTAPGDWYQALQKPWFDPPGWVFGPAWGLLYVLIAIAGWRISRRGELRAARIWWLQLGLNFLWPFLFFRVHATGLALVEIVLLLAVICAFIALTWRADRVSALLFVPYGAWVTFATLLNGAIWWLN
ncbi:TspO/MBR family protein [Aurantimonas sp. A2-1-M11]|uniref:TspO/MBR family protein n=1 Tax=Aurantimonas sp. A2-1-M11 TaxID=3113712 RepID=UPI002F93D55B